MRIINCDKTVSFVSFGISSTEEIIKNSVVEINKPEKSKVYECQSCNKVGKLDLTPIF